MSSLRTLDAAAALALLAIGVSACGSSTAGPAPQGLTASARTGQRPLNVLRWKDAEPNGSKVRYRVYEQIGAQRSQKPVLRWSGSGTHVALPALRGRDYFYSVRSVGPDGESKPSTIEVFQRAYVPDDPAVRNCRQGTFKPGCSPWNQPIPKDARHYDDPSTPDVNEGREIARRLGGWNYNEEESVPWNPLVAPDRDFEMPVYYAHDGDPRYRIRCNQFGGGCEIANASVAIPRGAEPAGGGCTRRQQSAKNCDVDGHLSVVEPDGTEFDLWQAEPPSGRDGDTLDVSTGGMTSVDEDGLWSDATALHNGALGGSVTAFEQASGTIAHALAMVVPCVRADERFVYPAGGDASRCGGPDAPRTGDRIRLDPRYDIDSATYPTWLRPWLRALQRYGAYVMDTGGSTVGLRRLSDQTYTSFSGGGQGSYYRYITGIAAQPGIKFDENRTSGADPHFDDRFVLDFRQGTWIDHLQVIDPCVTKKTC